MSAALEELLEKIHTAALVRGEAWLREKVAEIIAEEGSQDPPPCAKRGRALERRSPSPVPKIQRKNPLEVSGGPCPASEGPCPAKNPFSVGSDSRDGDKGLRIPVNAASQRGSDSEPSSSAENQKSSSSKSGQQCFSPSPNLRTVKAETCDSDSNRKVPGTTQSSNAEESIEFRIDRLLQSCSAAIELQQEEDERSEPTPAPVSSSVPGRPPYSVWILVNSFVTSALEKVSLDPDGRQLGFPYSEATIRWLGLMDLTWESVIPTVVHYSHSYRPPDILVIHAGGDDIYRGVSIKDLVENVKLDISKLKSLLPGAFIAWSQIVVRCRHPMTENENTLNHNCRTVNMQLLKYLKRKKKAWVIRHKVFERDVFHIFEEDGSCLNSVGRKIWCFDIKEEIKKIIKFWLRRPKI
ncbi:uncharacterized protein ACNLHF_028401 isoform 3-T3 [Anomaloglossus baeobatrachus]|uniref:uncharacterized protein LOC142251706 isoform X4 n=1 Tax=Anomaloglossus baeobatrachus TaxID=238106 RepID=UPI003F4F79F7